MPTVDIRIRWADGTVQDGESPSRVIERHITSGALYPRDELRRRLADGLAAASDRVRERFGMACTQAMAQSQEFELAALQHGGDPESLSRVELVKVSPPAPLHPHRRLPRHVSVAVIGGGQAGLSISRYLTDADIDHVVIEREHIAATWTTQRWDSFCLVTPNWQCRLPGFPYRGDDPEGFMVREQIIAYLRGFATSFAPPVHEGVAVKRLTAHRDAAFELETSRGTLTADQVVLAVGSYHRAVLPRLAERLPTRVTQLHSSAYKNPESLPDGAVLVVGSGQSGAQIAEDLHLAGRDVHLAVGSAPRVARFYRGRDCVAWLEDMGHYDMSIDDHPEGVGARKEANHYVTGRDGGRDIDLRTHARSGMTLHGRLVTAESGVLGFAPDLVANLDRADETSQRIKDRIDHWIAEQRIDAPVEAPYVPVWVPEGDGSAPLDLAAGGVSTVIWATGFLSDWAFVDAPAFDGRGYPSHHRGVTSVPGLYVLGLSWLHTWGSARFAGIARDAAYLAECICERAAAPFGTGAADELAA
ncbi:MAG TPA: MSMEG_0569 family flavin-dependent oxidoreductase [Solirubrobacteraceae bacterium]|nr:MSMEG_0569 family flavin-dependent oxidoreductase [Solirubrobacteraceae bacterium]